MACEERRDLAAHEREHDVVNEADIGDGPFDIQERDARYSMNLFDGGGFRHDQ